MSSMSKSPWWMPLFKAYRTKGKTHSQFKGDLAKVEKMVRTLDISDETRQQVMYALVEIHLKGEGVPPPKELVKASER